MRPHHQFAVSLTDEGSGHVFSISENGKSRSYLIPGKDHGDYMDLFATIARDFQTRVPLNRQTPPAPTFQAPYRVLLTDNLSPRMLYGYGDPSVLRVNDAGEIWYYVVSTSNDAADAFPIVRSRDLKVWEFRSFVFPSGHTPAWAAVGENVADFWAPELHWVGGEFRLYFVAREKDTRDLCIGVAKANSPEGPFTPEAKPLLRGDKINPHLFIENDGAAFLYWKEDSNGLWPGLLNALIFEEPSYITKLFEREEDRKSASLAATLWPWTRALKPMEIFFVQQPLIEAVTSDFAHFENKLEALALSEPDSRLNRIAQLLKTRVCAQQLSPDGTRLLGKPKLVLQNDQAWEAHVVEGMWIVKNAGKYYMFYAGNDFSTRDYGIGVAVAPSLFGPYRKSTKAFLRSTEQWFAPGHPSFAMGPDGEPMLFFHAFPPGIAGYKQFRALLCASLGFEGEFPNVQS